jgi:hypothetical protein
MRKRLFRGKRFVKVLRWLVDPEKIFTDYTWADVRVRFGLVEPKTGDILPETS